MQALKKIRLIESIAFRSEPLPAGAVREFPELDARQLVLAGHAEFVAEVVANNAAKADSKTPRNHKEQ